MERLYGKQNCIRRDVENAEVVLFIGTNPWQSHGIRNARLVLREIPERSKPPNDRHDREDGDCGDVRSPFATAPRHDAFLMSAIRR